jgi:hypothetical protein
MNQRMVRPGMMERRPRSYASSDSRTTCSAGISPGTSPAAVCPAISCHSVGTGPGLTARARTPVPRSSWCRASVKLSGERLAGAVHGLVGDRLHPGGGRDDDDAPPPSLDHRGEEGVGERDDGLAVDAHLLDLAVSVELHEASVGAEPGVVDEQVDAEPEVGDLAGKRASLGGEVAGNDMGGAVKALGEGLEPIAATGDEDEVVPAGGELAGELLTDPRGGPCDQRGVGTSCCSRSARHQIPRSPSPLKSLALTTAQAYSPGVAARAALRIDSPGLRREERV